MTESLLRISVEKIRVLPEDLLENEDHLSTINGGISVFVPPLPPN